MLTVSGLNNYIVPYPMSLKANTLGEVVAYATGSGPSNTFIGVDFKNAYAPGVRLRGWARQSDCLNLTATT